ncbi:MAG: transcription antitermination factor NusB [Candidatus Midichloriaceae bacterium]|jgi:transcription antitermination factor NusB
MVMEKYEDSINQKEDIHLYTSRMLAVQSIYSFNLLGDIKSPSQISLDYISYYTSNYLMQNLNQSFYLNLFKHTYENIALIDGEIQKRLQESWKLHRLSKIILAILRVGVSELFLKHEKNIAIIINDYLQISKSLGHTDETGFVNGILDSVAKEIS